MKRKTALVSVFFLAALLRFFGIADNYPPVHPPSVSTTTTSIGAGDEPPIRVKGG